MPGRFSARVAVPAGAGLGEGGAEARPVWVKEALDGLFAGANAKKFHLLRVVSAFPLLARRFITDFYVSPTWSNRLKLLTPEKQ